jgi:hypothetical protein
VLVCAVIDDSLSSASPLGDAVETFIRREDAERFVDEVRTDEPELASYLRIEERELEAGASLPNAEAALTGPLPGTGFVTGAV